MGRVRFSRSPRARLAQLVVAGVVASAGALAFGAGSAFAGGMVDCAPFGTDTAADVQTAANGGGTVTIFGVCAGTVDLTVPVTLQGGTGGATSGLDATTTPGAPVIIVEASATPVTVRNLLVTGAVNVPGGSNSFGDGGGIWVNSGCAPTTVNVVGSRVVGNTLTGFDAWGAGLNAECATTLNVTNTVVRGNTAQGVEGNGAGIVSDRAAAINVSGSTITRNSAGGFGGGIYAGDTVLNVTASTVSSNTSANDGGGIEGFVSDVLVQNSKLSGNVADGYGGGIDYGGTFSSDDGGARPASATRVFAHGPQAPAGQHSAPTGVARPALVTVVPPGLTVLDSSVDHNTVLTGAGGGIDAGDGCEGDVPVAITDSTVSFNRTLGTDFDTDSGGGGYSQYADCFTVSMVATGSTFVGNLARGIVGGGIFNVSYDGTGLVTLASTNVASGPPYLNPNQAEFGGGIFNWDTNSNVTLQSGGNIIHNQATVTGGGVFNDCGATLNVAPGALIMFNMPNQVVTNLGPCLLVD